MCYYHLILQEEKVPKRNEMSETRGRNENLLLKRGWQLGLLNAITVYYNLQDC